MQQKCHYVNGWDSLTVVNNPSPNGVNNSAKVGKYVDPLGEQWATLLMDNQKSLIDLSKTTNSMSNCGVPKQCLSYLNWKVGLVLHLQRSMGKYHRCQPMGRLCY